MEKIKASEILAMNPELSLEEIKSFRFFAIDKGGEEYLYDNKPSIKRFAQGEVWFSKGNSLFIGDKTGWENSLREIDFSEEDENQHDFCPLFLHLSQEHNLTLTDEQLYEIILLAQEIKLP